ncbi:MAG: type IV toxin-antitoxin system AbiEi family antitoxin domain-containing protein [Actinomycetota bacterium]|nr:type IV toxin-antitoxin system AbiEi family antitoxin domain-containing protein [Actinomycetota bacterium]
MTPEQVARKQQGTISRNQATAAGLTPKQLTQLVTSGRWKRLHPGVFATSNGTPSWKTTAFAALLRAGPGAALALDASAYVWRLVDNPPEVIEIVVPARRRPRTPPGTSIRRRRTLHSVNVEGFRVTGAAATILDLADLPTMTLDEVIALIAKACQRQRTSAELLLLDLKSRRRHRLRRQLLLALGEIAGGVESLAEHRFVQRVERAHGLPTFERQVVERGGSVRRDFKNSRYGVNVEIDGQVWHAGERFHADRARDRASAREGEVTLRATWVDVDGTPCELAADIGMTCVRRGWPGPVLRCSPACSVA